MNILLSITFILLGATANSADRYHVNMYDLQNGTTKYVLTDLCNVEHETVFKNSELDTDKPLKWLQKLTEEKKVDSCIDSK